MKYVWVVGGVALYFILTNLIFGTVCPTMFLFGVPCPACGMTRAGVAFLTGRFAESFRMHPLFVPSAIFIVWAAALKLFRPSELKRLQNPAIALIAVGFVLYIFRMAILFPYHPPMTMNSDSVLHNIINILGGM